MLDQAKTCFVIIGYGVKNDPATGRKLNLDKTYEDIIKPVLNSLHIDGFRAIDKNKTGSIDALMFQWILRSDIVIADISTLNTNVIYELGIRHALRPYSTIIISEESIMQDLPFDIDHTIIHQYRHLETEIGYGEVKRFRRVLRGLLKSALQSPKIDSPVYVFLKNLEAPKYKIEPRKREIKGIAIRPSLSDLISPGEEALNQNNFKEAKEFFKAALLYDKNNTYLIQRISLVTYKENPTNLEALKEAERILFQLKPEETTDTETLGLSGAINKRIYEVTKDEIYLDKAIWYYERCFYIKQDYYAGINFAFELTIKATVTKDKYQAISFYFEANRVRTRVVKLCKEIISGESFDKRGDKIWILQSLAQAYVGLEQQAKLKNVYAQIEKLSKGKFDLDTFAEQNDKLSINVAKFKKRFKLIKSWSTFSS